MSKVIDIEAVVEAPVKPRTKKKATKKRATKKTTADDRKKLASKLRKETNTPKKRRAAKKKGEIVLCHWNGRFGNRMHQYAYGVTYAKKYKLEFVLPSDWEGMRLFKKQYHEVSGDDNLRLYLNQTQKDLDTLDSRSNAMKEYGARKNLNFEYINPDNTEQTWCGKKAVFFDSVCAYNPKIFEGMSAKYLKKVFEFSEHIKNLDAYKKFEDIQGTYDVGHLRRDDISNADYNKANVQGYSVLSLDAYNKAFKKFDQDPKKIEWISDDYTKQWHKGREDSPRGGWSYPEGCSYMGADVVFDWIHDFFKMYFARKVFRANSSFSWWAGFLSPKAKVYSPVVNKQHIYGRDNDGEKKEIELDFVEGNQAHWMHNQADIVFKP